MVANVTYALNVLHVTVLQGYYKRPVKQSKRRPHEYDKVRWKKRNKKKRINS